MAGALDPSLPGANRASAGAGTAAVPLDRLTPRETQVLALLMAGETDPGIAANLDRSERTVERHIANILDKLGVRTRTAAATLAINQGVDQTADTASS